MPSRNTYVQGLNRALKVTKAQTMGGVLAACMVIIGDAKRKVPREDGNLFGSAFVERHPTKRLTAVIGFSAEYAFWIHENTEMKWAGQERRSKKGVYWGPDGEPKYLERALARRRQAIPRIVAADIRRRGGLRDARGA